MTPIKTISIKKAIMANIKAIKKYINNAEFLFFLHVTVFTNLANSKVEKEAIEANLKSEHGMTISTHNIIPENEKTLII